MESCTVITVSDRSAAGERADLAGPALVDRLEQAGFPASGIPQAVPNHERDRRLT